MKANMKSVMIRAGEICFEDRPRPEPGEGQVLIKSRCCGICGSDLHMFKHADQMLELGKQAGLVPSDVTVPPDVLLGHEFCGEVVAYGPGTTGELAPGQRVCSIPFLLTETGRVPIGTTDQVFGAYSEFFLLSEALLIPVPDEMPDAAVALVEPLAVGIHAVARGAIRTHEAALVIGCGPIGLAVIAALKMQGIETIVASDPVKSRRALAEKLGARRTVDPTAEDEIAAANEVAVGQPVVIYECVGIPALIPNLIERAPQKARIVFTGVHTEEVTIAPALAMTKELDLRFSFYYAPEEFTDAFHAIADGKINWKPLYTGKVGFDGVAEAFNTLAGPNDHVKIMVEPWRSGALEAVESE